MYINKYNEIKWNDRSKEEENKIKEFLETLDRFESDSDKFLGYLKENITQFNPKLQIEIWKFLPEDIVNNPENIEIFENVLDNKFGEYINGIDKKALVSILNASRTISRTN